MLATLRNVNEEVECRKRLPVLVVEEEILRFIGAHYGAESLLYLQAHVAAQVCKRPADFILAAKRRCEPELRL